ncbi:MAG: signal protein, partial [Treponema sp.]|nr:signal protein [Treponema sp.]
MSGFFRNRVRRPAALSLLFFALSLSGLGALTDLYWEPPAAFSGISGSFPVSASGENLSVVAWQEPFAVSSGGRESFQIGVSLGVKSSGESWRILPNIAGPYGYAGTEPAILSIALDKQDRIIIAAAVSAARTQILVSEDLGQSFSSYWLNMGSEGSVAPRIMVRSDGGYLLFVTRSL